MFMLNIFLGTFDQWKLIAMNIKHMNIFIH